MKLQKVYSDSKTTRFELVEDHCFRHVDGELIRIPAGYRTDFASVPRMLWWFIPPHGFSAEASIVHDYLYDNRIGSRFDADLKFYKDLHSVLPSWQSLVMFASVRIFAQRWWDT